MPKPFNGSISISARAQSSAGSITFRTYGRSIRRSATMARRHSISGNADAIALAFATIEDRLDAIVAFLLTARPSDLWKARGLPSAAALDAALDAEFGEGAVALGRQVFAKTCAKCHSSQEPPYDNVDFRATDAKDPTLRLDWLSNGRPLLASRIGTHPARALHSNHMASRVWDQYAARDLHDRAVDPKLPEVLKGGGRGYYRPVSLLSLWAFAPFMHNDAIGPEVCSTPADPALDFYVSPYVDSDGKPLPNPPSCWPFDPSVEGRWKLYKASMDELLHPDRRIPKIALTGEDIVVDVVPRIKIGNIDTGLSLRVPKGTPALLLNSLRYKDLVQDIVLIDREPGKARGKVPRSFAAGAARGFAAKSRAAARFAARRRQILQLRSDPSRRPIHPDLLFQRAGAGGK